MRCRSLILKLDSHAMNKAQCKALDEHFLAAKRLRNAAIANDCAWDYKKTTVPVKFGERFEERSVASLPAKLRQGVLAELSWNLRSLVALKRKGHTVGRLKFTNRVTSLPLNGYGQTHTVTGNKLKILGIPGKLRLLGTRQLADVKELGGARLLRKASGYYLSLTTWSEVQIAKPLKLAPIGLDFGIKTHITLSDGREWNAMVEEPERLKRLQRKLQRQIKGSNNYWRTRTALQKQYERISNKRDELANQFVSELKTHSLVAFQDENLRGWKAQPGFGNVVHHSAMGRVKAKLRRLPQAVMIDRYAPTTQLCSNCGTLNKLSLSERNYSCKCGYSASRDIHAASNILFLATTKINTPGEPGSAPVDQKTTAVELSSMVSPAGLKQETSISREEIVSHVLGTEKRRPSRRRS